MKPSRLSGPRDQQTASPATTASTTRDATVLVPIGGGAAVDALRRGDVDAAVFVISPSSPMIQSLLQEESLRLLQFHRHEAYARRFPFLTGTTLPEGVIDLGRDLPPRDVDLIAPAANLVARPGLHPTLVPLVCKAITARPRGPRRPAQPAGAVLRPPTMSSGRWTPPPATISAPGRLSCSGTCHSGWRRFCTASKILLLPLITLLFPLFRIAPPLYRWRRGRNLPLVPHPARRRRHARRRRGTAKPALRPAGRGPVGRTATGPRLDAELATVKVPLSYMDEFYNLRLHTDFVRRRLEAKVGAGDGVMA